MDRVVSVYPAVCSPVLPHVIRQKLLNGFRIKLVFVVALYVVEGIYFGGCHFNAFLLY